MHISHRFVGSADATQKVYGENSTQVGTNQVYRDTVLGKVLSLPFTVSGSVWATRQREAVHGAQDCVGQHCSERRAATIWKLNVQLPLDIIQFLNTFLLQHLILYTQHCLENKRCLIREDVFSIILHVNTSGKSPPASASSCTVSEDLQDGDAGQTLLSRGGRDSILEFPNSAPVRVKVVGND